MNTQAEARFKAAKERVAMSPDDLPTLKQFAEAARAFDKRDDAVSAMKSAYQRRPTPELYAELRSICTYPEFQAIAKPPEKPGAIPPPQPGTGAELLPRKTFPLLLDQVIFFPVQDGLSVFILATCAFLMCLGYLFGFAMGGIAVAATIICFGVVYGYLWSVMHASGMGEKQTRGWPDLTRPEEFGGAMMQYIMVKVVCFAPGFFLIVWPLIHGEKPGPASILGGLLLWAAGVAYYPMALMLAGFTHNFWEALNLPSAMRSVARMPMDYLICLGFFVVTFLVEVGIEWTLAKTSQTAPFPIQILLGIFLRTIDVYVLILQMRAVGLLYYTREKDLGWFQ